MQLVFEYRFCTEANCKACLVALRWPQGFVGPDCTGHAAWRTTRGAKVAHDWHSLPQVALTVAPVVPRDVVADKPEMRNRCDGVQRVHGLGREVPHGLDMAPVRWWPMGYPPTWSSPSGGTVTSARASSAVEIQPVWRCLGSTAWSRGLTVGGLARNQ